MSVCKTCSAIGGYHRSWCKNRTSERGFIFIQPSPAKSGDR